MAKAAGMIRSRNALKAIIIIAHPVGCGKGRVFLKTVRPFILEQLAKLVFFGDGCTFIASPKRQGANGGKQNGF